MALPLHQLHLQFNRARRRDRIFRDRTNPFDTLNDFEFVRHFRFSKDNTHRIIGLFRRFIEPTTRRNHALSPECQILLILHYLGTNSVQRDDARLSGVKQPTACRIIHKVVHVFASHRADHVKFPTGNDRIEAEAGFRRLARALNVDPLPGVVASVDGCHVRLEMSPCHALPGTMPFFCNIHCNYPIPYSLACDASLMCVDVVARWYGSAHDSRVFQNSSLGERFDDGRYQGILLADSAYPNVNYILKPIRNPTTDPQKRYNLSQIACRGIIERFNGILKNRFRCLKGLRLHLEHVEGVIVACVVLHNVGIELKQPEPDESDADEDNDQEDSDDEPDDQNGNQPLQSRAQFILANFP